MAAGLVSLATARCVALIPPYPPEYASLTLVSVPALGHGSWYGVFTAGQATGATPAQGADLATRVTMSVVEQQERPASGSSKKGFRVAPARVGKQQCDPGMRSDRVRGGRRQR